MSLLNKLISGRRKKTKNSSVGLIMKCHLSFV
jgi:hypothetical protein